MINLITLMIQLYRKYKLQRKYLNAKMYNKYRATQKEIDMIYRAMHETLSMKFLSRNNYIYCKCGNDLYDGSSEIFFSEDDMMELIECRKCKSLTCVSHEIGPCPIKVEFRWVNFELHCDMFGDDTKIYWKLNKLLEDYKNKALRG